MRMIYPRRMRWAEYVVRLGEMKKSYILVRKPKGRDHCETKA